MTKKLFVVLVVVAAMVVTISWAMAAKKGVKGVLETFEMQKFTNQQSATHMPQGQLAEKKVTISLMPERSTKEAATTTTVGPVQGQLNRAGGGKDFCDLYGTPAYAITDWFYGLEWYANYQDPEEFGCVDVWPFEVVEVGFNIQVDYAQSIDVTGYVFDADFSVPDCPVPGAILCETPMYTIDLPSDGHWIVGLPMTDQCCVDGPYFAGIYIWTDLYGTGADAVSEDNVPCDCRSYNDYGSGWEDLCVDYGWPGPMMLWSDGYTAPQNDCGAPPETLCELMHDNGSAASYFSGWNVGDLNAVYMDPEVLCPDCDPVYPIRIQKVKGYFYDFAGAGAVDVIVHFYEVGALCDGPGAEIYSFGPVTVTDFYPNAWAEIPVPDVFCVDGPFFLAIEYAGGTAGSIPSLLFDNQQNMVDTCYQWNFYDGYSPPWIEWWDFWAPPIPGWLMLRAIGECDAMCPVECYMQQDPGAIASYFGSFAAGDVFAKFFDPEVYCVAPVYPVKIDYVDVLLYDFADVGTVDMIVDLDIVCQDICDGPGTQIYKSEPITVTTFYPNMARIYLPDEVCMYEPFFLTLEYATGIQGETPSFIWSDETYPCDTCHAWLWWESGGYPFWIEWHDFWVPPAGGCPIVRVGGSTNNPLCVEEPCDTTQETLEGGPYAYYVWRNPSQYGHFFVAQRFDMPLDHGGRLDEIEIAFYATYSTGTPNPDFYVWLSDGVLPLDNNPPYQAIADFHMAYGDIVWYPSWNVVQTWERGINLDPGESFHVGYGHAFIDGDTLVALSDDGLVSPTQASSQYYPPDNAWFTILEDYGIDVDLLINAVICPFPVSESTFTIACSPFINYATPGDPPAVKYQVDIGSVIGYTLPVDLSCTPPDPGISVSFDPDNVPCPYTSDVTVSVDPSVSYGDYTLTFCGTGSDGQGPKCCNVTLKVQPPYDEAEVDFYHGMQRASNFGAVGNDARDNFIWYGASTLFDGSFVVATTDAAHMALDIYNCQYWDWAPDTHIDCYYDAQYNANVCFGNFYSELNIPGEHDSVFIVGIMDSCIDFSIKIKVYYNDGVDPITDMYIALFEDWDIGDAYNNWGDMDPDHNLMYQNEPVAPNLVFGMMKAPFYDDPMYNMWFVRNPRFVWPNSGFCDDGGGFWGLDSLYWLMTQPGFFYPEAPDTDFSLMMTAGPISLAPGEKHIEVWIDFGRDLNDGLSWSQWWHRVLRYAGFYRGDVNASDTLEVPSLDISDLVYLAQYLWMGGPAPIPYVDQGDVNGDRTVNIADVVYLGNTIFVAGAPPIDYVRFIPQFWPRTSLFENPNWH